MSDFLDQIIAPPVVEVTMRPCLVVGPKFATSEEFEAAFPNDARAPMVIIFEDENGDRNSRALREAQAMISTAPLSIAILVATKIPLMGDCVAAC